MATASNQREPPTGTVRPRSASAVPRAQPQPRPAGREHCLAPRADPIPGTTGCASSRAGAAGAVPVRARHRPFPAGRARHAARASTFSTFIYPGVLAMSVLFTAIFSAALDRLGPRVRLPARDAGRAGSRRSRWSSASAWAARPWPRFQGLIILALAGLVARPVQPGDVPGSHRDAAAAVVHAHRVRRDGGGADHPDAGVHGAQPDAGHAAVLPVRRAVPAERAADLAGHR